MTDLNFIVFLAFVPERHGGLAQTEQREFPPPFPIAGNSSLVHGLGIILFKGNLYGSGAVCTCVKSTKRF